jgi:Chemotaxis signal transduction protein
MKQQVVLFRIDDEEYAIAKDVVKAAVRYPQKSKLPAAPDYLEDVISVRGRIIPVISLYAKFGLPRDLKQDRWVLVLDVGQRIGLLVDEVTEILQMTVATVKSTPGIHNERGSCIGGIGKVDGRLIVLLDPVRLFTKSELTPLLGSQISGL